MTKDRSDRVEDTTDTERRSNSSGENRPLAPAASVLELDEVFSALSHPRRRYLLHTLVNESSEESLSELATKVAAWKQDRTTDDVTREERRRVHASLYHSHVPRLADLDIVEYHKGDDIIVRARHTDQLKAVLNGAGAELDSRQEKHAQQRDTGGSDDVEESE
jgi:DNA-binding transcriptional ArsR family regulator